MSNKRNERYMTSSNLDAGGFVGAVSGQHSSIGRLNGIEKIQSESLVVAFGALALISGYPIFTGLHRVKVGPQKVQPSERVNRIKPLHTR